MQISCGDVYERLQRGEEFRLIDLRGPEVEPLEGAEAATEELMESLLALPKETEIVFLCQHGIASLEVAGFFREQGFPHTLSMTGGVTAWAREVNPEPRADRG